MQRRSVYAAVIVLLSAGLLAGGEARAASSDCGRQPDFNGDIFGTLA